MTAVVGAIPADPRRTELRMQRLERKVRLARHNLWRRPLAFYGSGTSPSSFPE